MALTKGEKKRLARLRASQRSSLVFQKDSTGKSKRLTDEQLSQRRARIQRNIDDLTSRRGGTRESIGSRRSNVPSVTDTNINELMTRNLGQQGGLTPSNISTPSPNSVNRGASPNSVNLDPRVQSIFSQFVPGEGIYKQGRLVDRKMGFSPNLMDSLRLNTGGFSFNPQTAPTMRNSSSVPSIYSQLLPGESVSNQNNDRIQTLGIGVGSQGQTTYVPLTELAQQAEQDILFGLPILSTLNKIYESAVNKGRDFFGNDTQTQTQRPMGFSTGLMDSLRLNTGGFPTMGGVPSAAPPVLTPIRVGSGTVGDFRNQLFSNQALNTGLFSAPLLTEFNVPIGPFEKQKYNLELQEALDASRQENPNINAFIDPNLPPSTAGIIRGVNLTSSPTGTEFDIFGNRRSFGADEIINRFGDTINQALDGKSYTII